MPSGFAEHLKHKEAVAAVGNDAMRELQEEARRHPEKYPGGQVPMAELKPDPPERSIQGGPEVVRFGLAPGGRIVRIS